MGSQVNTDGHAPAVTHTEAPASATTKVVSPAGFEYLLTMRSTKVSDVLSQAATLESWLTAHDWTPAPSYSKPSHHAINSVSSEAGICDTCGEAMTQKPRRDGNGTFWSCGTRKGGNWCKGRPKAT